MKKVLGYLVGVIFLLPILVFAADRTVSYANTDPWIETDKDVYNLGEEIRVHFYNAPGYARDWICIVPSGSQESEAGDYQYMPEGVGQGVLIFKSPRPGEYEVRAYYNYSPFRYAVSARYRFAVEGADYGYEGQYGAGYGNEDEYVDVPVVYGEPMYYAPPVVVTFAYDYFTYEMYGPYVDIVFWRGGHRYRNKPWYDHGRRTTPDYIHTNPRHRIRSTEFYKHREKLQTNHNITHSDNYYGLKHPKQPAQQRLSPKYQGSQWEQKQTRQIEQRPQWEKKSPQNIEPRPQLKQQPQQKTIWGQRQSQQIKQRPQQLEQKSQRGGRQSQGSQLERKPSRQIEKRAPSQEKQKERNDH